jgi:4-amino-4-deoxy-L-arabinose transferase-like glycosyltransferase
VIRLPELTRSSLWYDELFSLGVAGLPAGESLRRIIADHTNPPLFYLLLKGWMALGGDSDAWVRLLPCLFAILLGAAMVWLVEEARVGRLAGALALALAAASPLAVDLATEVRAYSLLALLASLSLAAALRLRRDDTRDSFALLTLINVALVHTHYFGWLTVAAEMAAAWLWWNRDAARRVTRSAALAALAFLPWAATVVAHATSNPAPLRNVTWIAPPSVLEPVWLWRDLTGRWLAGAVNNAWLVLLAVALLALLYGTFRPRSGRSAGAPAADRDTVALLLMAAVVMPLGVFVLSVATGHSLWVQRYLVGAAAPTALLAAVAVCALPPRRWPVAAAAGFLWAIGAFAAVPQRAPTKFDWRRFTQRIDLAPGSPRNVYALEAFTGAPLLRYAGLGMRVTMVPSLEALPPGPSWLVYRRESFPAAGPAEHLHALGFTVLTALSAETAGQKIVAVRINR